jgi:hypothetical protein
MKDRADNDVVGTPKRVLYLDCTGWLVYSEQSDIDSPIPAAP